MPDIDAQKIDHALLPPEILKPGRRELRIADRVLDVFVTEIRLQRPRIVTLVCQRVPAGMTEHMRVGLERKLRFVARPFNHAVEARRGEWGGSLGGEHKG
jgi:hypothetical protein